MNVISKRKLLRTFKDEHGAKMWCEAVVQVRQSENGPELSITGSAGYVVASKVARAEALRYWESYFEDEPEQIADMNKRMGFRCRTAKGAARKVIECDGDYHGLDVHAATEHKVYATTACGQITEELQEHFPELTSLLPYHLNGMKAGCAHQRVLGWGHGKTVALSPDDLTDAQRSSLLDAETKRIKPLREQAFRLQWEALKTDPVARLQITRDVCQTKSVSVYEAGRVHAAIFTPDLLFGTQKKFLADIKAAVQCKVETEIQPVPFAGAIYKDCLCAPCPTCGYKYGTQWLYEPLPDNVLKAALEFGAAC